MMFRVTIKESDEQEREVKIEVAISLRNKFGIDEAAKKLGIPTSSVVKVIRVS